MTRDTVRTVKAVKKKRKKKKVTPEPSRWWHPKLLAGIGTAVVGIATAWFNTDTLQSKVCPAFGWEAAQKAIDGLPKCDGDWERYNEKEASDFLFRYLGEAGGANPELSRKFFVTSKRDGIRDEWIEKQWGTVLWADMKEEATPIDGFNRFAVEYTTYHGDNGVDDNYDRADGFALDWILEARLTQDPADDNEIKIMKILAQQEIDMHEDLHFPAVKSKEDTEARKLPTRDIEPTGAVNWRANKPGPAFCRTAVPLGSQNYWYRTRMGWVDGKVFDLTEDAIADCHPVSAERATAVEERVAAEEAEGR